MTAWNDVFGVDNIYPSYVSYRAFSIAADTQLNWPLETTAVDNPVSAINAVTSSAAGLAILMPEAPAGSPGFPAIFTNGGIYSYEVQRSDAIAIATIAPGEAWYIYLTSNATTAGTWASFQFGAYVSAANAASLAGPGLKAIGGLLGQEASISTFNSNYTAGTSDRATTFIWNGTSGTLAIDDPVGMGNGWFIGLSNQGSASVTVSPNGTVTIDGESSKIFDPGESAYILTDGLNFYTLGYGQATTFAFDNTSINISGTGDYTIAGAELNRISYNLTGTLTGNRNFIVPATVQQYWIRNATTGSYTLTVKLSASTGVEVAQGESAILYSDGSEVRLADTGGISIPIDITQGGTGATSASGARTNLGATSVGNALFIAADQAAAWTALGIAQAGNIDGGTF